MKAYVCLSRMFLLSTEERIATSAQKAFTEKLCFEFLSFSGTGSCYHYVSFFLYVEVLRSLKFSHSGVCKMSQLHSKFTGLG